jgi:Mg-chelatase subunit ChlD
VEKNVVFVIDVSGSMFGTKMKQVTRALGTYLSPGIRRTRKQRVLAHWGLDTRDPFPCHP